MFSGCCGEIGSSASPEPWRPHSSPQIARSHRRAHRAGTSWCEAPLLRSAIAWWKSVRPSELTGPRSRIAGTQQHPVGSQRPLRRHAMEASSARLRSGGASSSALSGKRLQIAARKRPTSAGTRKRVVVAAARGSDGGWLLGRGARVLAFALFKARKARRGDGIQSVFAKALGGAGRAGLPRKKCIASLSSLGWAESP